MTRFTTFCDYLLFKVVMPVFAFITLVLAVLQGMGIDWWPLLMGGLK